jgi:hypothetical protein
MKLFTHGVPDTGYMWTPLVEALDLSQDAYLAPTLPGFDGRTLAGFLWAGPDRWYLRPRRIAGLIRMKVSAEGDINRCRLVLDRVADPFRSQITTTAGIWTPSRVITHRHCSPEEKACSLDPEQRCRPQEAEENRKQDRQKGGVPNWSYRPASQLGILSPPSGAPRLLAPPRPPASARLPLAAG